MTIEVDADMSGAKTPRDYTADYLARAFERLADALDSHIATVVASPASLRGLASNIRAGLGLDEAVAEVMFDTVESAASKAVDHETVADLPIDWRAGVPWLCRARWHSLLSTTSAMNVGCGVLIREVVKCGGSISTSLAYVEDMRVGQRWVVSVEDDCIGIRKEVALVGYKQTGRDLIVANRFCWFLADENMPKPTDEQIRAVAMAGLRLT